VFLNIRTEDDTVDRIGQKIKLQTSVYSPNNDGLQIYISQGSAATQLTCLLQISHRIIMPVKNFGKQVNIWRIYGEKFAADFFGPPCI